MASYTVVVKLPSGSVVFTRRPSLSYANVDPLLVAVRVVAGTCDASVRAGRRDELPQRVVLERGAVVDLTETQAKAWADKFEHASTVMVDSNPAGDDSPDDDDPVKRLAYISEQTQELKDTKRALGAETLTQVIVLHKLPQRIALADRERQTLLFQAVTFHLFL